MLLWDTDHSQDTDALPARLKLDSLMDIEKNRKLSADDPA